MTTTLTISGMHCAGCAAGVRAALLAMPGVAAANVDLASRSAMIEHAASVDPRGLVRAVEERGFHATIAGPER